MSSNKPTKIDDDLLIVQIVQVAGRLLTAGNSTLHVAPLQITDMARRYGSGLAVNHAISASSQQTGKNCRTFA